MIVSLENRGLIARTPGLARSIRLLVPAEALPGIEGARQAPSSSGTGFAERYPNIAAWIKSHGRIELGYQYQSDTCARAIDDGGMVWGGGDVHQTPDEWLQELERGVAERVKELELR